MVMLPVTADTGTSHTTGLRATTTSTSLSILKLADRLAEAAEALLVELFTVADRFDGHREAFTVELHLVGGDDQRPESLDVKLVVCDLGSRV
jgi:hypothetical protein